MKQKKNRGIEAIKRRYGILFVSPWVLGVILFVIAPILKTLVFSLSIVSMGEKGLQTQFVGFKHYYRLLMENTIYVDRLAASLTSIFTSLPIIVSLSLILGVVLNQKFRGRMLVRGIFFLPVIISSGVVMYVLNGQGNVTGMNISTTLSTETSAYVNAIDFTELLSRLSLPSDINELMMKYLSDTFNLLWSCGVQTLLFIAGLQTIPSQLYEVARVEGATSWESFWYITIPMLNRVVMLVVFYTMVELFVEDSALVNSALQDMRWHTIYDSTSAQLWIYFFCVGIIIGLVMLVYSKVFLKRWG
jgi:ABC-type sugar transport system permease subunit